MSSKDGKAESKKSKRLKAEKEENLSTNQQPDSSKNETAAVHSANSWEKVDLGDDDRKNKFLRLMGATKKEHHGRFVIGDSRTERERTKEDVEKLTEDLEEQYDQGMGLVLSGAARQHKGLGFQETDTVPEEPVPVELVPEEPAPVEKSEEDERPRKKKSKRDKDSGAKDEETKGEKTEDKRKPKPLLGFVKASSG